MGEGSVTEGLVSVRLLDFPVGLWARADDETRDLMREFALISIDRHEHEVPRRLLELVAELQESYGPLGTSQTSQLEEARAKGEETIDELVYELPPRISNDVVRLGQMLDEADEYCRRGEHLLSLASSPGAKAFRDWFLEQFTSQLEGEEAVPWPQSRQASLLEGAGTE